MSMVFHNLLLSPIVKEIKEKYNLSQDEALLCRSFALKYLKMREKGTLQRYKKRLVNFYMKRGLWESVIDDLLKKLLLLIYSTKYDLVLEYDKKFKTLLIRYKVPPRNIPLYYAFANKVASLARKHSGDTLDKAINALTSYYSTLYDLGKTSLGEVAKLTLSYYRKIIK